MLRSDETPIRWAVLLDFAAEGTPEAVTELGLEDRVVVAGSGSGTFRYRLGDTSLGVSHPGGELELSGALTHAETPQSLFASKPSWDAVAEVPRAWVVPPLDGSLEGFDQSDPLELDSELQYRRSEEPFDPETFQARGWLSWDDEALYLALEVEKPEVVPYDPGAPPLLLDNEADDLHADGLQIYLGLEEGVVVGHVVTLEASGSLHARLVDWGAPSEGGIDGAWSPTDRGYRITLAVREPRLQTIGEGGTVRFDLVVNEMRPGRQRRAGQLVWSGGGGWVYLRGDRHDPARLGRLRLR